MVKNKKNNLDKPLKAKRRSKRKKEIVTLPPSPPSSPPPPPIIFQTSEYPMDSITSILNTLELYNESRSLYNVKPNGDMELLSIIQEDLIELKNMIGMDLFKEQIVDQILMIIQGIGSSEFMHTVIAGPPGTGKTKVANIIANIYSGLGLLSSGHVMKPMRSDFVGRYLGETADKTRKYLKKCLGGVCLLDEAYSMGAPGERGADSFAKEAMDTINQFLSEEAEDFMMIIVGYEESLETCFFAQNPGLHRRFPWKFTIKSYKSKELGNIFRLQAAKEEFTISENVDITKFTSDLAMFVGNGGDTQNFFDRIKIAHSRRIFGNEDCIKKMLTTKDFEKGWEKFKELKQKGRDSGPPPNMYV